LFPDPSSFVCGKGLDGANGIESAMTTDDQADAEANLVEDEAGRGTKRDREDGSNNSTGVLRMRGLPFSASVQDVLIFFAGYEVVDGADGANVLFCKENGGRGRPSGQGFVEFKSLEDAKEARSRNRSEMGGRYIELFTSTREEYEHFRLQNSNEGGGSALSLNGQDLAVNDDGKDPNRFVKMRGLPFNATAADLAQFFVRVKAGSSNGGNGATGDAVTSGCMVRMRGLPFTASEADVISFFGAEFQGSIQGDDSTDDSSVAINFGTDRSGRASGEAWVTFSTAADAERAVQLRNRQHMGSRYVELFVETGGGGAAVAPGVGTIGQTAAEGAPEDAMEDTAAPSAPPLSAPPLSAPPPQVARGADGKWAIRFRYTGIGQGGRPMPSGEAFVEFESGADAERALALDRQHIGSRYSPH
jgi:hypothetical protein